MNDNKTKEQCIIEQAFLHGIDLKALPVEFEHNWEVITNANN